MDDNTTEASKDQGAGESMDEIRSGPLTILKDSDIHKTHKKRCVRLWYSGITSAFQAEEAGSIPVGRLVGEPGTARFFRVRWSAHATWPTQKEV